MNSDVIPVWALAADSTSELPRIGGAGGITAERLGEFRTALAAWSESPLVTLEAHPLRTPVDVRHGMPLAALSPLAQELSRLVSSTPNVASTISTNNGEVLYRMVVPAKAAAQMGKGALRPMRSTVVPGGVLSGLVDESSKKLAASAAFVPVTGGTKAAAAGGGTAALGGVAVGGGAAGALAAVTVAAPLILMAVAVSASAQSEARRQEALDTITGLLEELQDSALQQRRDALDGCRAALDSATALLLDGSPVGSMHGMDSAAGVINTSVSTATRILDEWTMKADALKSSEKVELADIESRFPGLFAREGAFIADLEVMHLTLALKRRLIVLQAVEAAQRSPENTLDRFSQKLSLDQAHVDALEERLRELLRGLSALRISPVKGVRATVLPRKQVEKMLEQIESLRALGSEYQPVETGDVVVEIVQHTDGQLHVLPPISA